MKLVNDITHAMVLDKAREHLDRDDQFDKSAVLAETPFGAYGHLVQWWFIRQTLERELGESLMPVHANGNDWDPSVQPEKFLPSSHRKTTGYARASAYPSAVAETYMQRRYNQAAGTVTGMNQIATSFQKQGISIDYTPVTLPPLQVAHSA